MEKEEKRRVGREIWSTLWLLLDVTWCMGNNWYRSVMVGAREN